MTSLYYHCAHMVESLGTGGTLMVLGNVAFSTGLWGVTELCGPLAQASCVRMTCSSVLCSASCSGILRTRHSSSASSMTSGSSVPDALVRKRGHYLAFPSSGGLSAKILHSLKSSWKGFFLYAVQPYGLCLTCDLTPTLHVPFTWSDTWSLTLRKNKLQKSNF